MNFKPNVDSNALASKTTNKSRATASSTAKDCFECGSYEHWAKDCPNKFADGASGGKGQNQPSSFTGGDSIF